MADEPPPLDDEIRGLYQGPLAAFVAGRQALAKRLRGDPRQEEVKALAKPSLSAWAVNRLFALEPEAMAELFGAGERARASQGERGRADAATLAGLVATIRNGIERLTGRGIEILAEGGRAPGEAIVERLRTDLQALAFDPASAPVAERGWLDRDLEPPGFELLAALTVAATAARPRPRPAPEPTAAPEAESERPSATVHDLDEARRAAAERAEREARERRERLERARTELARAESAAAEARRAADRARNDAERAERGAKDAEQRAEAAREEARTARRDAGEAERRAADAAAGERRAREELSRAERAAESS